LHKYIPVCEIGAKAWAEARTARKAKSCLNILMSLLLIVMNGGLESFVVDRLAGSKEG